MGRGVELPSFKTRLTRRQGLRKPSPDLLSKARDDTASQVTRIGLTFLGTAAFCLLSLFSPDSALLGGSEKIIVPFAGPVSFRGFMLLGPAVLIVLRVYLQIYVDHSNRLDRLARSVSVVRAPTLVPLQNPLIRFFSGLTFYLLLPAAIILFAWKAAAFPVWGLGLFSVAAAVIASHVLLPFGAVSWRKKVLMSVSAATIAACLMSVFGSPRRPLNLYHANLSGQWLLEDDLRDADLRSANLSNVSLHNANLSSANLTDVKLTGADLSSAKLIDANLVGADLSSANLTGADLSSAALRFANLTGAGLNSANLTGADLVSANLTGAYLLTTKLIDVDLTLADLSSAALRFANLTGAGLNSVNLTGADLVSANLTGAYLVTTKLIDVDLTLADLSSANLFGADLSSAKNLTQSQLDKACGDADTKLPAGFTLKRCETN